MSTENTQPEPMRYHGPGWNLDRTTRGDDDQIVAGRVFQLWAPQDGAIPDPHSYATHQAEDWRPRLTWAAAIVAVAGTGVPSDFRRGASMAEVMAIFPDDVRAIFAEAVRRATPTEAAR